VKYILIQEEHHKTKPFREEYLEILEKNNVEFKEEYLFEFFSDIKDGDLILRCSAPMVMFFKCISTNILQLCCLYNGYKVYYEIIIADE